MYSPYIVRDSCPLGFGKGAAPRDDLARNDPACIVDWYEDGVWSQYWC